MLDFFWITFSEFIMYILLYGPHSGQTFPYIANIPCWHFRCLNPKRRCATFHVDEFENIDVHYSIIRRIIRRIIRPVVILPIKNIPPASSDLSCTVR
ncbi:hypothetical protein M758_10G021300 [Ceratodon purpureus]|nr:hypothetical protein M758_10G021300 [Ceratodon purpureus]